jgi:hypothetical protein
LGQPILASLMKKREAVLWIQVPLKLLNPSLSQL